MTTKNLLVELFVEELPPKALKKLGESFAETLKTGLVSLGLATAGSRLTAYASPRRLAAHLTDVLSQAADKPVSHKLMPVNVGLDAHGQPTPALLKKLASLGADASAAARLKRRIDGKAEALFYDSVLPGASLAEGLQKALEDAIAKLPIPKMMSYQLDDGWTSVNFVRPAHALVALYGAEVVPVSVLGLQAGRGTQGHRFEAAKSPVVIRDADSYAEQMETEGAVIPGFNARRADIARQLQAAAAKEGLKPIDDAALLDEVTALVERPNVLVGHFEAAFLAVPQECLILTMKANQKYFPLLDARGKLTNRFLLVSNIRPVDPGAVVGGNERVVRPRLADAKFFFDHDRKKTLVSRINHLERVVYHNKLGNQLQRTERVRAIALEIARSLVKRGLAETALEAFVDEAAYLAKTDLLTDMVGEFPELQGIMGRYYALNDGKLEEIANAIEDHYRPRFAGDELPRNMTGVVVALADKLETLVGLFGIGQQPSGDKDPFALRRHALGVIRMLIERDLPLDLNALLTQAAAAFGGQIQDASPALTDFIYERLAGSLKEQGYSAQEIDAVLTLRPQRLSDAAKRMDAVRAFDGLPESASLAAANKRVGNILKKADGAPDTVNTALLKEAAEIALHRALNEVAPKANRAFEQGNYTASLQALAALKVPVDAFFDDVMVNTDDAALRANRLGLLAQLHGAMNRVADLSKLAAS